MSNSDLPQLSAILQRARARSGMTVRQLSEKSGLVPSTLSRLETGLVAEPRPGHLQRLARALGIDVEELYAAAGYSVSGQLPELQTYLRDKFGITGEQATRVQGLVESVRDQQQSSEEGQDDNSRDQAY